jgi:hypothetical protein
LVNLATSHLNMFMWTFYVYSRVPCREKF